MRAIILAGGKGTRLQPLTANIPKPMVPMFDRPLMEHAIRLLALHGFDDITVTISYKADHITDFLGDGSRFGVKIGYFVEDVPRGTCGGLVDLKETLPTTFLVMSGDALTDFNLTEALYYHRANRAKATLLTFEVSDPSQFGIVDADCQGRVQRFIEKPGAGEAFGNTVNTGIYVLEPEVIDQIPAGSVFDFSRDLFPQLLKQPDALWAKRMYGYWCDVGNLAKYRDAHFDALSRRARIQIPGNGIIPGVWVGRNCQIDPTARICAPVYLGEGVIVGANAFVGGFAVIGDGCVIGEGARVFQSIVNCDAYVAPGSTVYGSVIGAGHALPESMDIEHRVVLAQEIMQEISPVAEILCMEEDVSGRLHHHFRRIQQPDSNMQSAA